MENKQEKYDKVMMDTAISFAELSYCKRMKVGCVISRDGRILVTGYNGTISATENICEEYSQECQDEDKVVCKDCNGYGYTLGYLDMGNRGKFPCETCKRSGKHCKDLGKERYITKRLYNICNSFPL